MVVHWSSKVVGQHSTGRRRAKEKEAEEARGEEVMVGKVKKKSQPDRRLRKYHMGVRK